ncbi:MAG: VWA domain-containing protein [Spirochaetia bacterium]
MVVSPLWAQKATDFILMVDISASMFEEKGEQVELLVKDVMKRQLSYRDTFHLISFGNDTNFEISRTLRDQKQIEEVLARLMLLQPLDSNTDIVSALKFLGEYAKELPLHTNKQILILSDDAHDPPPDSSFSIGPENERRIESIADYFKRNGWKANIVIFPSDGKQIDVQTGLLAELAALLGTTPVAHNGDIDETSLAATGAIEIIYPSDIIETGRRGLSLPLTIVNHGSSEATFRLTAVRHRGANLLKQTASVVLPPAESGSINVELELPSGLEEGAHTVQIELGVEGAPNAFPLTNEIRIMVDQSTGGSGLGDFNRYYLLIPLLLIVFVLIFLLVRRMFGGSSKDEDKRRVPSSGSTDFSGFGRKAPTDRKFAEGIGYRKDEDKSGTLLSEAKRGSFEDRVSPYDSSGVSSGGNHLGEARDAFESFKNSSSKSKSGLPLREKSPSDTADSVSVLGSYAAREKGERDRIPLSLKEKSKSKSSQQRAQQRMRGMRKGKEGEIGVEMRADFQHNFLGRNTHWFSPGDSFSLGAPGEADYQITSIEIDGVIANVRRVNENLSLTPIQEDYFPELHGKPVENCLGRHFRVVNPESGKETALVFKKYIPPLERINRLLHMTDAPGKPDDEVID